MGILKFIIRRLLFGVFTLVVIAFSVFSLSQLLTSDPAQVFLGRDARPESLAAKREEFGLNKPKLQQFWDWFNQLFFHFNPGKSFSGEDIWGFMKDRIVNSMFLMLVCSLVCIPIAIFIGAMAARKRDGAFDNTTSFASLALAAVPEFVIGVLLIVLLSTNVWHQFPATVRIRPGEQPWDHPDSLILPVLTLTLAVVPYVSRTMRASTIEVLESDYIEMARLKGLSESTVLWRHAVPNAIGPTLQVIALNVAYLVTGVITIEVLFNYKGISGALLDAVHAHNMPLVQFIAVFVAAIYVLVNLLADVGTILVTPRLRTSMK
ncbi:MAG TPA: ABC transporter permease [Ilumatobacteraceae bacterium]|nr:ABC transporter permease [Ilumatobacteraceae bacterium]HUC33008.1 ABC transporter permease [Ilumatobacteraceae bacterium]